MKRTQRAWSVALPADLPTLRLLPAHARMFPGDGRSASRIHLSVPGWGPVNLMVAPDRRWWLVDGGVLGDIAVTDEPRPRWVARTPGGRVMVVRTRIEALRALTDEADRFAGHAR